MEHHRNDSEDSPEPDNRSEKECGDGDSYERISPTLAASVGDDAHKKEDTGPDPRKRKHRQDHHRFGVTGPFTAQPSQGRGKHHARTFETGEQ